MLKHVIFFALAAIVANKIYRYYKFMGYARSKEDINEYQLSNCVRKYENLTDASSMKNDRRKIFKIANTLDSDILPNGICMFSSGEFYPFLETNRTQRVLLRQAQKNTSIFMLDMNYLEQLRPVAIDIVDNELKPKDANDFNLYSMSIYQDEMRNFKLVASNFNSSNRSTRIEKFTYDLNRHVLVHTNSILSTTNLNDLCDLVVVEDYLIYFTKCFMDSTYKLNLEIKSGEIWVINLTDNVMFRVARNLFFPKAIAYLRSLDIILVTNLAADGISLYKKESDLTLTKLNDIYLDSFVFNINVDNNNNIWLIVHPILHETIHFFSNNKQQADEIASKLYRIKVEFNKKGSLLKYVVEEIFSTNGSLLNAVGSSVFFNNFLIMFSLLSDPKVCLLPNK